MTSEREDDNETEGPKQVRARRRSGAVTGDEDRQRVCVALVFEVLPDQLVDQHVAPRRLGLALILPQPSQPNESRTPQNAVVGARVPVCPVCTRAQCVRISWRCRAVPTPRSVCPAPSLHRAQCAGLQERHRPAWMVRTVSLSSAWKISARMRALMSPSTPRFCSVTLRAGSSTAPVQQLKDGSCRWKASPASGRASGGGGGRGAPSFRSSRFPAMTRPPPSPPPGGVGPAGSPRNPTR